MQAQIAVLSQQARENERLKTLLKFKKEIHSPVIACRVLSREMTSWREWLAIDKGSDEGVVKNMAVVTPQGLVGRVLSSAIHSSRVMLITDSQSRVSVRIRETRDAGIVEGNGSGMLTLRLVDLGVELKSGQTLETAGLGGIYPKGVTVGTVVTVWTENNGLYQAASIKPSADFSKLEELACLNSLEK